MIVFERSAAMLHWWGRWCSKSSFWLIAG